MSDPHGRDGAAIVPTWAGDETRAADCPVCGSKGRKRLLLTCPSVTDRATMLDFVACDACGSVFVPDYVEPDYTRYRSEEAALRFYVEQGAGVDILVRVPQCFRHRRGLRYCEVGCGFGFSVDYARLMNDWDAVGVDPSPIAARGRAMLGLDIVSAYLPDRASDLGRFDILMASEVIEHIAEPDTFLRALRAHLAPEGVVVLSTPSARVITPDHGLGIVIPALSPGYHAVIYSADSLRQVLLRAGFSHVTVRERDATLVAVASDAPVPEEPWLAPEPEDAEAYFQARASLERRGSPVEIGLRTRLHRSLVNRAAFAQAELAFEELRLSVGEAYGFDLGDPEAVEARLSPVPRGDLDALVGASPAGLASALYAHGLACHLGVSDRVRARAYLALAGRAAILLREALAPVGADDGDAQTIGWSAEEIRLHVLAFDDPLAAAAGILALKQTPATPHYRFDSPALVENTVDRLYNHLLCIPGAEAACRTLGAEGIGRQL